MKGKCFNFLGDSITEGVGVSDAKPLAAYVEVIKAAGARHNIPVLDLYTKLPIDPKVAEDAQRYTVDGLHFNDAGHAILADCLIDFLKEL